MTPYRNRLSAIGAIFARGLKAVAGIPTAMLQSSWGNMTPTYTAYKYDTFVREGYLKNELIFACINARANTTAAVSLKVYDKATHEERVDHALRTLLSHPNPYISEHDFWKMCITNLDLAGLAPFQKVRGIGGQVVQLWPIRPDAFSIVPSSTEYIKNYVFKDALGKETAIDPADVILFIERDPRNPLEPVSRAQIAGRIVDVDNSVTDYIRLYWEQGGAPLGLLMSKNKLLPEQIMRARATWAERYGGFRRWNAPIVLDSDMQYQQIGSTFKDMDFQIQDGRSEARICTVMGVPPIIVGTTIGLARNTFSNYGEARKAWWEDVLTPLYKKLADHIMADLAPDFGDDVYVKWDVSEVPALREDQDSRWTRATAALTAGGITVNDFRREIGLSIDDVGGDIYLRNSLETAVAQNDGGQEDNLEDTTSDDKASRFSFEKKDSSISREPSDKLVKEYSAQMSDLAAQARSGAITADTFEARMKALIYQAMVAQAAAAGTVSSTDLERIQKDAEAQYEYVSKFADVVGSLDENSARSRAELYAKATRQQYWKQGIPVELDAYPGDGQTKCGSNCDCSLRCDTDSKPGYCLVYWERGNSANPCENCQYWAVTWNPLEVEMSEE